MTAAGDDNLADLIAQSAVGSREAFRRLYEATAPRLNTLARRITRDEALADEVLQESFVQVWYAAGTYDRVKAPPNAWLAGIVRHRALDAIRREQSQRARRDAAAREPDIKRSLEPGQLAVLGSDLKALAHCIAELEPRQQTALLLAYYYGCSHREVALELETPLGTAKSLIRRGLALVRECLDR